MNFEKIAFLNSHSLVSGELESRGAFKVVCLSGTATKETLAQAWVRPSRPL